MVKKSAKTVKAEKKEVEEVKETKERKTKGLFIRRLVVFSCKAPANAVVSVAGSFNDWDPEVKKLTYSEEKDLFTGRLYLMPGVYEYKFVVNGAWLLDENNPERCPNGMDSFNSVLNVK